MTAGHQLLLTASSKQVAERVVWHPVRRRTTSGRTPASSDCRSV